MSKDFMELTPREWQDEPNGPPTTLSITGYCAANYREGDRYSDEYCGPIRQSEEEAQIDYQQGQWDGIRYVHSDGYLYVDKP